MDIRRVVAGIGRTLIGFGVLVLLFVAYELWGTSLAEARSQHSLRRQFEQALRQPASPPTTSASSHLVTTTTEGPPAPPTGQAVAHLLIPKIGVDKFVVEGVGVPDLKKGPGHYPGTPLPGEAGNAAIAGHRTTYGAPFYRLNELMAGDKIRVLTRTGTFTYQVDRSIDVSPSDVGVLDPTKDNRLTLTTCTPRFSAAKRLIVVAHLVPNAAVPPLPPSSVPVTTPATAPVTQPARPLGQHALDGLSGGSEDATPALLWGLLAAAVALAAWLVGRRWRRWLTYTLFTPVFLVVLFVFFENVSRLLPANV